jgi:hypothetical protein
MRIVSPCALIGLALLLAACGEGRAHRAAAPTDWQRDCQGKPAPPIGDVTLQLVQRLAPDRVVLEARWARGRDATEGSIELLLPDGAWLVAGSAARTRAEKARDGVCRWTVGHRVGETLDAVVRLRRDVGERRRAREACVRLDGRAAD